MADYTDRVLKALAATQVAPSQPDMVRSTVSVKEKGSKYTVDVPNGANSIVYTIDGQVITKGNKCDKFIAFYKSNNQKNTKEGISVFLELKGHDVAHAITQIEETVKNALFRPYPAKDDKIRARIMTATCGPSSSSKKVFEAARIRFQKDYNIELGILKGLQKDRPIIW